MRQLTFATPFRLILAVLAFLVYVAVVVWHHYAYKSTWRTEQAGSLLVASSYLFYGTPFGTIAGDQWYYILKHLAFRPLSQEEPADTLLNISANHNRSPKPNSI